VKLINNLFEILEQTEYYIKIRLARKDHHIFKAHFPENEILPAFIQIDILMNILNQDITKILKAKFLAIIKPEDIIEYHITSISESKYKIIIKCENKKVSEILYEI